MTENPRRQLLRRARYATAGIAITAVAGTAGLAAVTANATDLASGSTGSGGSTDQRQWGTGTVRRVPGDTQAPGSSAGSGSGVTEAPAGQSQGGSNAS